MRAALQAQLVPRRPSLCPELVLELADAPVPLWEALEATTSKQEEPPFWGHAWPGSLALARAVLDAPLLVSDRTVLDFATGCGVSAIAAARSGARSVLATDIDAHAVRHALHNAALNGVQLEARCRDVIGVDESWQVVLVGDVFYEDALARRVWQWLRQLSSRGAQVLIGDPGRSFLPHAELECLATYSLEPNPAWDSVTDRPPRVWKLKT
ncbi:MAG: 50S ribosomal protein L11 methyltransferase [Myxococcaceae bacterium]